MAKQKTINQEILYLLTPGGLETKTKITRRFLIRKTEKYENLIQEIRRLEEVEAALADSK